MSVLFALIGVASAAEPPAPLHIAGAAAKQTYACAAGQEVVVEGASLTLTFTGDCGKVRVVGSMNAITLDGVAALVLEGSMNNVRWKRDLSGKERLPTSLVGTGNKVSHVE